MNFNFNELVKAQLECNLGCFVLEMLGASEYDMLDAYSVSIRFVPGSYVISRENYIFS